MATKLIMRRKGQRLECPTQSWADLLEEVAEGVDLSVKIVRSRSVPQLGTYWGVLKFVIEHGPEWIGKRWPTKDELSDALQLKVGFVRQISVIGLPEGTYYAVPASKSFAECSQERFNKFFNDVQAVLVQWCNFDAVLSYQQWLSSR